MKGVVEAVMDQLDEDIDEQVASEIALHVVDDAVNELEKAGANEDQIGEAVISTALFDLTEREIIAIQEMEDELIEDEIDMV